MAAAGRAGQWGPPPRVWPRQGNGRFNGLSPLDLGEIRDRKRCLADLVEQLETIGPYGALVDVDRYLVEERINRRPQFRDRRHGASESLARDGGTRFLPDAVDAGRERPFLGLAVELRIGHAGV